MGGVDALCGCGYGRRGWCEGGGCGLWIWVVCVDGVDGLCGWWIRVMWVVWSEGMGMGCGWLVVWCGWCVWCGWVMWVVDMDDVGGVE